MLNFISNGKFMIFHLIVGSIKKILLYKMWKYTNDATKSDLKDATGGHTSKLVKEIDSANLKWDIYWIYFDNLKTTPVKKQVM